MIERQNLINRYKQSILDSLEKYKSVIIHQPEGFLELYITKDNKYNFKTYTSEGLPIELDLILNGCLSINELMDKVLQEPKLFYISERKELEREIEIKDTTIKGLKKENNILFRLFQEIKESSNLELALHRNKIQEQSNWINELESNFQNKENLRNIYTDKITKLGELYMDKIIKLKDFLKKSSTNDK